MHLLKNCFVNEIMNSSLLYAVWLYGGLKKNYARIYFLQIICNKQVLDMVEGRNFSLFESQDHCDFFRYYFEMFQLSCKIMIIVFMPSIRSIKIPIMLKNTYLWAILVFHSSHYVRKNIMAQEINKIHWNAFNFSLVGRT